MPKFDPAVALGPWKGGQEFGTVLSYLQATQLKEPLKIHPLLEGLTWDPKPYGVNSYPSPLIAGSQHSLPHPSAISSTFRLLNRPFALSSSLDILPPAQHKPVSLVLGVRRLVAKSMGDADGGSLGRLLVKERFHPATSPKVEELHLLHDATGWAMRLTNRLGVNLTDVLHGIFDFFASPLYVDELGEMHPRAVRAMEQQYFEKRSLGFLDSFAGYRKSDALLGQSYFDGIKRNPEIVRGRLGYNTSNVLILSLVFPHLQDLLEQAPIRYLSLSLTGASGLINQVLDTMAEAHGEDNGEPGSDEYSTAPLTLLLAGIALLFSLLVIFRILWSKKNEEDGAHENGQEGRKLRRILVVCLLGSDFVIALGSVGPAAMVYRGLSLSGQQCNASGLTLALGLWWQYAFSLLIALTTYLSLRHPLCRVKRLLEQHAVPLVLIVLCLGTAQAVLWRFTMGYNGCHGFCFYGRPSELGAEVMQFVPRLVTSLGITAIYLPLIGFLRRPDAGAAYLGKPVAQSLGGIGRSSRETTPVGDSDPDLEGHGEIPPWEKLSFPTYTWDDKTKAIRVSSDDDEKRSSRVFFGGLGASVSMSLKVDMSPATTLRTFSSKQNLLDTPGSEKSTSKRPSSRFELPAPPQPALISSVNTPAPLQITSRVEAPLAVLPFDPPSRGSFRPPRPSTAPATLAPLPQAGPRALSRCRVAALRSHTPSASISTLPSLTNLDAQAQSDDPRVSFTNMLSYAPDTPDRFAAHRRTRSRSSTLVEMVETKLGRSRSRSRSGSPEIEGDKAVGNQRDVESTETMASFMRRRTRYYLLWFPLTHFILCIITVIRFIYVAAARVDNAYIDVLTLVVIMGQGLTDIVIFGLVEHRARLSYQREVASCMPQPVSLASSPSIPPSGGVPHLEEGMETLPTPVEEEPSRRIA